MARRNRFGLWGYSLVLGLAAAGPLLADGSLVGTLKGRVRDESGGALPGVTVELTSADKGFTRTETTDASGAFTFAVLPPGRYNGRATLSSFETFESDRQPGDRREDDGRRRQPEARGDRRDGHGLRLRAAGGQDERLRYDAHRFLADGLARRRPRLSERHRAHAGHRTTPTPTGTRTRTAPSTARICISSTASTRRTRRRAPSAPTTTSTRFRRSWSPTPRSPPSTAAPRAPSSTSSPSRARTSSMDPPGRS